jgi:plastocyanin
MRYWRYLATAALATLAACGGGGAAAPPSPTIPLPNGFAELFVSPATGSLEVGGTLQLTVVAKDAIGNELSGLPAPTFVSGDASRATVDANGLVTGVAGGAVIVRAILAAAGVTDTATASLVVNPPAPPASEVAPATATVSGSKAGLAPSTVTVAVGGTVTWTMDREEEHDVVWDGAAPAGGNIPRIEKQTSASRTFAAAGTYAYHCSRHGEPGAVVVKTATAPPTTPPVPPTTPSTATVTTVNVSFSPATVTIAAGGSVTWQISGATHNVTFAGAAPTGGNVPDTDSGGSASRTFATAGSYDYRCTRHDGMTGRVVVQ